MSRLIAIGSGKGGVGKSFFSANLCYLLSEMGQRVLLVDTDLGSGNIHTYLGMSEAKYSFSDFIRGRVTNIQQVVTPTPHEGLSIISGDNEDLDIQNMSEHLVQNLLTQLRSLPYDSVVLDLGAGNHNVFIDIFSQCDLSVLVATPERTSLENVLRFVKTAFFRKFYLAEQRGLGIGPALRQIHRRGNHKGETFYDILNLVSTNNLFMQKRIEAELKKLRLELVLNQVQTPNEIDRGLKFVRTCKDQFGIDAFFLGFISHSPDCRSAIESQKLLVSSNEQEEMREQFFRIINSLGAFSKGNENDVGVKLG